MPTAALGALSKTGACTAQHAACCRALGCCRRLCPAPSDVAGACTQALHPQPSSLLRLQRVHLESGLHHLCKRWHPATC